MHTQHPSSVRLPAILTAVLAIALLLSAPTPAHAAAPVARNDALTVQSATKATAKAVSVLANDTVSRKTRAKVAVLSKPTTFKATVNTTKQVVVTVPARTKAGTYRVRYRVTDYRGRRAAAYINIKITTPAPTVRSVLATLPVTTEHATGYDRDLYRHWIDADNDGCDTRREVLLSEATIRPAVGSGCSFTGGEWTSYYDGVTTADPSTFDIDHMVPLAEAHASGAHAWDSTTRMRYANDLHDLRALVAVTASSNRSKSDRDPAEWMPARNHCRYAREWIATKARWSLSVDTTEKTALTNITNDCPNSTLTVTKAAITKTADDSTTPTTNGPGITITTIRFDPTINTDDSSAAEYVTLHNSTNAPVVMTGWTLLDAATYLYTFPTYTLAANATVRVWVPAGADTQTDLYSGKSTAVWNNSGDSAALATSTGTVVDTCNYSTGVSGTATC